MRASLRRRPRARERSDAVRGGRPCTDGEHWTGVRPDRTPSESMLRPPTLGVDETTVRVEQHPGAGELGLFVIHVVGPLGSPPARFGMLLASSLKDMKYAQATQDGAPCRSEYRPYWKS